MKHYYRIGEIAKLYNIGPDSLRYYEELGILKPHRGENNYRMYHIHDIWRLNVIRDLRELGFSMERIRDYMDQRSLASTEEMLQQELNAIEEKMRSLEELKASIQERMANIREARNQPLEEVQEKYFPRRNCYYMKSSYNQDPEMDMLIKQLVNQYNDKLYIIGNNRNGSVIPLKQARKGHFGEYSGVFILDKNGDSYIEEGIYLSICYQGKCAKNAIYVPLLMGYAENHGLIPCDDVLELVWTDIHQTQNINEYITELQILCEKQTSNP